MTKYIVRRLLWMIPVILVVTLITFTLMHMAPGGPWDRDPGARQVDARTQQLLNTRFGLDKPLFFNFSDGNPLDSQFFGYLWGLVHLDLGPSYRIRGADVQDLLFKAPEDKPWWESKFGYSLRLGLYALVFSIIIGIPLGIVAALKQNTVVDYLSLFVATFGVSVPSFVIALFFIIIFAVGLHMVDIVIRDWSSFKPWIIPAAILGFPTMAFLTRLTRSSMLDIMTQDYIRTARSKGLHERRVVMLHMLKNSLIPVITILGPALAGLVTGSFIIEQIFGFPGIGREFVLSIQRRDYSMIMGTTLLYAVLVAFANLAVDILYGFVDPRIKVE
ncbi:MAG: ABC transporter permease [Chloroflexi bacterium]|nr:ABC transporter permease [Chloroflexota bacterium]